ncbi:MAG: TetR/AcrR family transcriptional regulator [Agathobacter sp.]|nr:TetR/AcrR family transcriptional regulator [Agathobacter sp.]
MYRQCTTEKTAQQQQTFYKALYSAMQERQYADITITDLCAQTGLSRNIFYRLFDCKDDVLYAFLDNCFYECSKEILSTTSKDGLKSFFHFWKREKHLLDVLERNHLESLLPIRAVLCCCRMDFGMHKFIHSEWNEYNIEILAFYTNGFIGLVFQWYHNNFSRSIEEMCEISHQILNFPPLAFDKPLDQ